jgi:hypothetical protein
MGTREKKKSFLSPCLLKKKKTGLFMITCGAFPFAA